MDWGIVLDYIFELAYFLGVFGLFFLVTIFKGRQAIMNVMFGLYLALLISIEFPYYDFLLGGLEGDTAVAGAKLAFFVVLTILGTMLCYRVMPEEFQEEKFESMGKKLLLTFGATALVMTFSFHVLPVTTFLTPGTPLQAIFGPEGYFFWWLLVPLAILYIV
jgi:uncharacterized membrane protein